MGFVNVNCPNCEYSGEIFHGSKKLLPDVTEDGTEGDGEYTGDLRLTVTTQLHQLYPLAFYSGLVDVSLLQESLLTS